MPGAGGGSGADPGARKLTFHLICERIVNANGQKDWREQRRWLSGGASVELQINNINLTPLYSSADQQAGA